MCYFDVVNVNKLLLVIVFNVNIGFDLQGLLLCLKGMGVNLVVSNFIDKWYFVGVDGCDNVFIGVLCIVGIFFCVDL